MILNIQGQSVLIDDADWPLISQYHWNIIKDKSKHSAYVRGYLKTEHYRSRKTVFIHRLLMGLDGPLVDHKNCNGLDNRRENLRHTTASGNARNSLRKKGVQVVEKRVYYTIKKYQARISIDGKAIDLGTYDTLEEAEVVYKKANAEQIKKECDKFPAKRYNVTK